MLDDNIFAQMQMLSEVESTTYEDTRQVMNQIVDFMYAQDWQQEQIEMFANLRSLKPETLIKAKSFMVRDDLAPNYFPEEFHHDSLGFIQGVRVVFSGRYVYPVFDVKGNVAGWVGYDMFETPKYLDSKNHGYVAKRGIMYGMQDMEQIYRDGYCVFVEGAVCKLAINEASLNSLSTLGSTVTPYYLSIIQRFGRNAIVLPDSDPRTGTFTPAGDKFAYAVRKHAPLARVHRFTKAKDYDDTRKLYPEVAEELQSLIKNPFKPRKFIK